MLQIQLPQEQFEILDSLQYLDLGNADKPKINVGLSKDSYVDIKPKLADAIQEQLDKKGLDMSLVEVDYLLVLSKSQYDFARPLILDKPDRIILATEDIDPQTFINGFEGYKTSLVATATLKDDDSLFME